MQETNIAAVATEVATATQEEVAALQEATTPTETPVETDIIHIQEKPKKGFSYKDGDSYFTKVIFPTAGKMLLITKNEVNDQCNDWKLKPTGQVMDTTYPAYQVMQAKKISAASH